MMAAPSPALAAAMAADGGALPAPAGAAVGLDGAPMPAPAVDRKKVAGEVASVIYGALMVAGAKFPTIGKEVTPDDAREVAESIIAAADAWGCLHLLAGGKWVLSIQALIAVGALGWKVKGAIEADTRGRAVSAPGVPAEGAPAGASPE